eukprot:TRINITY_DN369_c0_g1_i1.p1 TRINITY_DN369_c0_g1~~TRINITY_DN369_c0_g1_i1.p1  ORF type:complete len:339 (+),score=97.48 TRINITY_DN369_c0_g1_i1:73-1089(+)
MVWSLLMLVLCCAWETGGVVQGGDFEMPRVNTHRPFAPLYPWTSHSTAVAPYHEVDRHGRCGEQRQFLVCKGSSCWVNLRLRTFPGLTYRLQYAVNEEVFPGCVPGYCATLPETEQWPLECMPCDKPHGLSISGVERSAGSVSGADDCAVAPVFSQMQVDFEATDVDTDVTWFPKSISANPRGHFRIDSVSVFLVCGSVLVPIDESVDDPRQVCPPAAAQHGRTGVELDMQTTPTSTRSVVTKLAVSGVCVCAAAILAWMVSRLCRRSSSNKKVPDVEERGTKEVAAATSSDEAPVAEDRSQCDDARGEEELSGGEGELPADDGGEAAATPSLDVADP